MVACWYCFSAQSNSSVYVEAMLKLLHKMTTAKSCCFIQDKNIDINNKTARSKETWGFPIILTDKPSFFRGFNEEYILRQCYPESDPAFFIMSWPCNNCFQHRLMVINLIYLRLLLQWYYPFHLWKLAVVFFKGLINQTSFEARTERQGSWQKNCINLLS